jgi:hypothetical protein
MFLLYVEVFGVFTLRHIQSGSYLISLKCLRHVTTYTYNKKYVFFLHFLIICVKLFPATIDEYLTITSFNGAKYFY